MRLVIPYKYSEDSTELRYAIRSMVKHFSPLTGVLLIGDKPEWYCGDHLPLADIMYPDQPGRIWKERSMQLKVLAAPDDMFLYSNDDYFANKDFKTIPYYYDVTCGEMAANHTMASYKTMYEECRPDWNNFDVHTPMIIDKAKFKESFEQMISMDCQWPIKTTYAHTFQGTRFSDLKIRGQHTYEELEWLTKDRDFFSTHNSAIDIELISFLENKYPNKSPYELS